MQRSIEKAGTQTAMYSAPPAVPAAPLRTTLSPGRITFPVSSRTGYIDGNHPLIREIEELA